jgi:uncharacterized protein YjbI with pentapeptide repeats
MRANFTNADLSNASLLGLVVSSGLDISPAEAAVFRGANLTGADLSGADLTGADLTGADATEADLGGAVLR